MRMLMNHNRILGTPLQTPSLQKTVLDTLRQAILEREIEPGQQINLAKLAVELQVSTMPIREALRELAAEGLVAFEKNKRITVKRISREDISDLYSIRLPLEMMALARCWVRLTPKDLEVLEDLHKQMSRPGVVGREWFGLNQAFHVKLHKMSGSERLTRILQTLWGNTGQYFRIFSDDEQAVARANREHELLVGALHKGDRAEARRVLKAHLKTGIDAINAALDTEE